MEPHARYTLVGGVVLLLLAAGVFAILWLTRAGDGQYDRYLVYFRRHSLSGLQVDSAVTMRGIPVGRVEALRIAAPDIERVRVVLRIDEDTPIKTDTRAVVQRNLLTGLASIDLIGSTRESKPLLPAAEDEFPVIPEGSSQFEAIASDLPKLLEKVNTIADSFAGFLTDENKESVSNILKNIDVLTSAVTDEDGQLKGLVRDLSALSESLSDFTRHLDARTHEIANAMTSTSNTVTLEVQNVSRDLSRAARELVETLERYQNPASIVSGPPPFALGPGEQGAASR